MGYFLQQLINGLTLGMIYGLIAIGYTMVYGIIGMINFAHGGLWVRGESGARRTARGGRRSRFRRSRGGGPILRAQVIRTGQFYYTFRTPPVQGVRAGRDYRVVLRLVDPESRDVMARVEKNFRSTADQSVLPDRAPVTGPGYQSSSGTSDG